MKILVAGDFVPNGRLAERINTGVFDCIKSIKPLLSAVDYSIINLECPVCEQPSRAIHKIGPSLKCTPKAIEAIKYTGFKCVTLANNHFNDYGSIGVTNTITSINIKGLDYVGAGMNLEEASKVLYKQINGETIGIINCCENEFSIATNNTPGSNPLNPVIQYNAIKEARDNADYVLVIVHGGHEGYPLPSPRMQRVYRFFVDAGADAVINHHQHCFSGFELYKSKPIFYGLGNFCFDKLFTNTPSTWYEGFMVVIDLKKQSVSFKLYPYVQCKEKAEISLLEDDSYKLKLESLNHIIEDPELLNLHFSQFCKKRKDVITTDLLAPVGNRFLLAAARRHLIPSFLSNNRLLRVMNIIRCESHKDILLNALEQQLNGD